MNRSEIAPFSLYILAVLALMLLPFAANAQVKGAVYPNCLKVSDNLAQAKTLNITADKIMVVYDVEFISAFVKAAGATIPDGSSPKAIMLVEANSTQAYVALVEQDGCIIHEASIPLRLYVKALKAATSSV